MAEDLTIDDRELRQLMTKIARVSLGNPKKIKVMLQKIGVIIQGTAKKFAPRSMTKTEYISTLDGGETERRNSSFTSGNLKKSITVEVKQARGGGSVEIGVPSNSLAGDYAEKMHDEQGSSWRFLGWQNDSKATHKYIYKAFEEEKRNINKELERYLDKVIKDLIGL